MSPPADFVDLRQLDGLRLAMGYARADNFTGAPLPGYAPSVAWLHRAAVEPLARVLSDLAPRGLTLLIFDAYRPVRATEAMVAWCEAHGREDLLNGYVGRTSRHNRGVAVDLGLAHLRSGRPLPMGSEWDDFSRASWTANAWGPARANRRALTEAMERRGFCGYRKEWWHFELPVDPLPEPLDLPYPDAGDAGGARSGA